MDYEKTYNSIIERANEKQYEEYTERHHVVPRCLGGSNKKTNLVSLSYREHFLCHWLLCKMYPNNHKLKAAFAKMLGGKRRVVSGWMYEVVKRNIRDTHFEWLQNKTPWNKGKTGLQVAWNKGLKFGPLSEEEKLKRSKALKKYYSKTTHHLKGTEPWNKGKAGLQVAWNKGLKAEKFICPYCSKAIAGKSNFERWHNNNCKDVR